MKHYLSLKDIELNGKRVVIREDFNVPLQEGKISDDTRLQAAIPSLKYLLEANAKVIILSHLGRPEPGADNQTLSLRPVADYLTKALNREVPLIEDYLSGVDLSDHDIILCENVRFNRGEKENDPELAKRYAELGDVFVMDAFATAHRAEASTEGVTHFVKVACAGPLLDAELTAFSRIMYAPKHPVLAIIGGSKVSSKLAVLQSLVEKVDVLIVGGGMANTFLAATGKPVGKSLLEKELISEANKILEKALSRRCEVLLPTDVVVATNVSADAVAKTISLDKLGFEEMILDIGPMTAKIYSEAIARANSILWNGPVGVFELPQFAEGTKALAKAIAESKAYSVAGGGDTLSAIAMCGVTERISYISTGGGAFLNLFEGKPLKAVAALEEKYHAQS